MDFKDVGWYASNTLSILEGARMPWHDVHMSLTGPMVLDIVQHFVERWNEIRVPPALSVTESGSVQEARDGVRREMDCDGGHSSIALNTTTPTVDTEVRCARRKLEWSTMLIQHLSPRRLDSPTMLDLGSMDSIYHASEDGAHGEERVRREGTLLRPRLARHSSMGFNSSHNRLFFQACQSSQRNWLVRDGRCRQGSIYLGDDVFMDSMGYKPGSMSTYPVQLGYLSRNESRNQEADDVSFKHNVSQRDDVSNRPAISQHNNSTNTVQASA
ncbi:hypothetical protein ARMSODRAFT_1027928 [Armillaria solidipes]|uniref:Uncharacterized protein n=1 Tax=Armillaria solidipes TaxID=1076256 RepID=A0A2H3APV9_9AGAR|nr:hypothetical protein ARMSODRAFT_1027928 [Armillaria solidipes]